MNIVFYINYLIAALHTHFQYNPPKTSIETQS